MGTYTSMSMIYKIENNWINGYDNGKLVYMHYIADPISRSKFILQLARSGELIQ